MRSKLFGKAAIIGIAVLVIIVLMLLMVPAIAANHSFPLDHVGIAPDEEICTLIDGNGDKQLVGNFSISQNNNSVGIVTLICKINDGQNDEGGVVFWTAENTELTPCRVGVGFTTDNWKIVVSASGNATLTCHVEIGI